MLADLSLQGHIEEIDGSVPGRIRDRDRPMQLPADGDGLPAEIIVDNGPEFAGTALDAWAALHGVDLWFITPGRPVENAYIESFNGHLRAEKFPIDTVIFTGGVSEHEMQDERGIEYARLRAQGRLAEIESGAPSAAARIAGYVVGGTVVVIGIVTVVLIIYSAVR